MELKKAVSVLEKHNKWRRGADTEPTNPKELGESIDTVTKYLKNRRIIWK